MNVRPIFILTLLLLCFNACSVKKDTSDNDLFPYKTPTQDIGAKNDNDSLLNIGNATNAPEYTINPQQSSGVDINDSQNIKNDKPLEASSIGNDNAKAIETSGTAKASTIIEWYPLDESLVKSLIVSPDEENKFTFEIIFTDSNMKCKIFKGELNSKVTLNSDFEYGAFKTFPVRLSFINNNNFSYLSLVVSWIDANGKTNIKSTYLVQNKLLITEIKEAIDAASRESSGEQKSGVGPNNHPVDIWLVDFCGYDSDYIYILGKHNDFYYGSPIKYSYNRVTKELKIVPLN